MLRTLAGVTLGGLAAASSAIALQELSPAFARMLNGRLAPRVSIEWLPIRGALPLRAMVGVFGRRFPSDLEIIRELGVPIARWGLLWHRMERERGVFSFEEYDEVANFGRKHGLRFCWTLGYGNPLYDGQYVVASETARAAFVRYAQECVRRYDDVAAFWEIWNEPNHPVWGFNDRDPVAYAQLVRQTARAIKALQPTGRVIAGSLSTVDEPYLRAMVAADLGSDVDIVSVQPYRWEPPETVLNDLPKARILVRGRPVAITEWGYSTHLDPLSPGPSLTEQGAYAARVMLTANVARLPLVVWYDASDDGPDKTWPDDNYGLVFTDLTPKPGYFAVKNLMALVGDRRPAAYVDAGRFFAVWYPSPTEPLTLLWASGLAPVTIDLLRPVEVIRLLDPARTPRLVRGSLVLPPDDLFAFSHPLENIIAAVR
ncbi:MAG: hypothetical protein RMM58_03620 [Chloroflexota bacterium]|nr:hypothetical protein [Dehalococcoidia bacterium]MDW8252949.1 hypothetical protein [Chloroflexota bacterium]